MFSTYLMKGGSTSKVGAASGLV